jgi:uncharacterized protein with PQ loop repeat
MDFRSEYLPYVGGLCFCIHSIPQMHKVYKTKSANYISYLSLLSLTCGLSSTLLLSVQNNDPFLYIPYGIGLMNVNILIFMKQYYDDGMLHKRIKTFTRNNLNQVNNEMETITGSSNDNESIDEVESIDEIERYDNEIFKVSNTDVFDDILTNIQINIKKTSIDFNNTRIDKKINSHSEKEISEVLKI